MVVRNNTGNIRPTTSIRVTVRPGAQRHAPLVEAHQRHDRRQPEGHLPGHEADPGRPTVPGVAGPDADGDDHGDDECREQQGDHSQQRRPHDGCRLERRRRSDRHDQAVRQGHPGGTSDEERAGQLEDRLERHRGRCHAANGEQGDLAPASVAPEHRRRRHEAGTGQCGQHGDRPHPTADDDLDGARPDRRRTATTTRSTARRTWPRPAPRSGDRPRSRPARRRCSRAVNPLRTRPGRPPRCPRTPARRRGRAPR